ncbi:sugar phosphate isomerase/epimerase [Dactylosporangium sp. AC04546]|uniref:sugar phosphate isomerase/epimerase family protein n=1 Tax=Dactylosporangium sp. AC04546 TaxID=2862460 RepID=UPI001EDFFD9D|nr:sugar phosphate isomerase/epimerase [Dactylosporangium sp. AC04546]WVK87095.1 sugar phosphate isomerase/epimerase [Dactylosporangium sp. AC04546]
MQIGCHGSVWTGTFDTDGLRLAIESTRAAGFDLIEIPLMDPGGIDRATVRALLAEHGLAATASLGLSARTDISSEDPDVVAAGERLLGTCLEVLADIGGTHLVGVIHCAMQKYLTPASPGGRRNSVEAIRRLAGRASDLGIRIGVEVVNRYESNLFNTGRQAVRYVEEVGAGNVFVHLDTYHMNIEEPDMYTPVLAAGDRLGYVHIGESHRGYLGSGTVDFDAFFRGLAHTGYDGPVVFESFSSAVVHPELSQMLAIWRNLWTDGADLGAHANAYIRGRLRSVASIGMH